MEPIATVAFKSTRLRIKGIVDSFSKPYETVERDVIVALRDAPNILFFQNRMKYHGYRAELTEYIPLEDREEASISSLMGKLILPSGF